MKIAVFHNLPAGGAKRVLDEEVKFLSKKHEVTVFKCDGGIKVRDLFILRKLHQKLAEKINQRGFAVCLVHPDKLTQAPFLLRYLRIPSLYYCEELLRIGYEKELEFKDKVVFFKKWYENMTRILRKKIDQDNARAATKIFVGSDYIKEKVKKAYGKKAEICPCGVDTSVFHSPKTKKIKQLLFIGEKEKINGFDLAKEVVNLLNNQVKLKIISGFKLTDSQLAAEYSRSFATLCISYNEPFGLVALESMACGTPVLAVNAGGYKETILDGKTGFLLKRNPKEFAEKVLYLIKHTQIRKRMGIIGRKHVIKNFSWQTHNQKLEKCLIKLAAYEV